MFHLSLNLQREVSGSFHPEAEMFGPLPLMENSSCGVKFLGNIEYKSNLQSFRTLPLNVLYRQSVIRRDPLISTEIPHRPSV